MAPVRKKFNYLTNAFAIVICIQCTSIFGLFMDSWKTEKVQISSAVLLL